MRLAGNPRHCRIPRDQERRDGKANADGFELAGPERGGLDVDPREEHGGARLARSMPLTPALASAAMHPPARAATAGYKPGVPRLLSGLH
jgi:hypothetical protein